MNLDDYILSHSDPEGDYLYRLWRATNIYTIHGRMASGHLQGRLLRMLVHMIRPRRILEVGTFSGYSAISMAEGLEGDGHLWTFEINDEMEDFTRKWIDESPVADRITFLIGDAITEAPILIAIGRVCSSTWCSSTATNAPMSKPTRWRCNCSAPAVSSWLTIPCGMVMWWTINTITTIRRKASSASTTMWQPTLE